MAQQTEQDHRPRSYWEHNDPLAEILASVSGKARRQMIRDFWNAGNLEALEETLLEDQLGEEQRASLGAIHPFFMGGEYLPDRLPGEVTIVRIELESTTHDVIELRARPLPKDKIGLRWVDEYETVFSHEGYSDTIEQPFSFEELKAFISATDPGGWGTLPLCYNEGNCPDGDASTADGLRHFTRFSSEFYPQVSDWVEQLVDEWIEEKYDREEETE